MLDPLTGCSEHSPNDQDIFISLVAFDGLPHGPGVISLGPSPRNPAVRLSEAESPLPKHSVKCGVERPSTPSLHLMASRKLVHSVQRKIGRREFLFTIASRLPLGPGKQNIETTNTASLIFEISEMTCLRMQVVQARRTDALDALFRVRNERAPG